MDSITENNINLDIYKPYNKWMKVESKKSNRKKISSLQDDKITPVKKYWNGFSKDGKELWYIELNTGVVISDCNKEYYSWIKKYNSQYLS
jgi:hypothetical protein